MKTGLRRAVPKVEEDEVECECLLTDGTEDRDAVAEAVEGHGDRGVTAHPALVVAEPDVEATSAGERKG